MKSAIIGIGGKMLIVSVIIGRRQSHDVNFVIFHPLPPPAGESSQDNDRRIE
jgi:hypothetical protein